MVYRLGIDQQARGFCDAISRRQVVFAFDGGIGIGDGFARGGVDDLAFETGFNKKKRRAGTR